jgi:hypothetical protein
LPVTPPVIFPTKVFAVIIPVNSAFLHFLLILPKSYVPDISGFKLEPKSPSTLIVSEEESPRFIVPPSNVTFYF